MTEKIQIVGTSDIDNQPIIGEVQPTTTKAGELEPAIITPRQNAGVSAVQLDGSEITRAAVFDIGSQTEYIHIDGANKLIQTNNFVSGSSGWQIKGNGDAEFANGTFRGTVTANAGAIGGFEVGDSYIRDTANSFGLSSTVTGGNDPRFWAGTTLTNIANAPVRIYEDGSLVATNINATGSIYATSGWIGSPTALVYESQGINTGITGFIRGGQTSYNTGTGYFLGYDAGQYKLSIGSATSGQYMNWDGSELIINDSPIVNSTIFGDGSDGDASISGLTLVDSYSEANQSGDLTGVNGAESLLDSYNESNQSATYQIYSGNFLGVGQAFTATAGVLSSCKFYIRKSGSPTGNAVAKLYATTGTFGTNARPTGAALATSANFDVSTLTTSYVVNTLTFSGANRVKLTNGTNYVITFEYSGGNSTNRVELGADSTSPTHAGNGSSLFGASWSGSSQDVCFYVYLAPILTTIGQSFDAIAGTLDSCKFYLKKTGSPTGNAVAKLYAHTGSYGTSGTPTGSVLATSDNLDVSTLTTSYVLTTLTFTGANKYLLVAGTKYFIVFEYTDGDGSNTVSVGNDTSASSHGGNAAIYTTTWASSANDICFYVYAIATVNLTSDVFYDNLTVLTTAMINPNGYRIFVKNTLTFEGLGKIFCNGGDGVVGVDGGGLGTAAGGAGGAAANTAGSLPASSAGNNGGTGSSSAPTAGSSTNIAKGVGVAGVAGGTGGTGVSGSGAAGGAAGTITGTVYNKLNNFISAYNFFDVNPSFTQFSGSSTSGGGGGGMGSAGPNTTGGGGGGSGASGGIVWVAARKIVTSGTNTYLQAIGGNGAAGGAGAGAASYGSGGGGGGGSGGVVVLTYSRKTGSGVIDVSGGSGGAAGTTGSTAGTAGLTGKTYIFQV